MRHPVIPYDLELRRQRFAHAYEALQPYIDAWENPHPGGWRDQIVQRLNADSKS